MAWLALIRSGLNLVLRDPSLTLPQITWATIFIMISAYCIPVLRHEILMLYLLVMIFGAFRLDRAGFLTVDAMAVGGYAAVILALALRHPGEINLAIALVSWLGFAVVATVLSLLGAELSDLRRQIVRQNRQMRIAWTASRKCPDRRTDRHLNRRHIWSSCATRRPWPTGAAIPSWGHAGLDHFRRSTTASATAPATRLASPAGAMRAGLRQVDRVGRVGGEEFLLLLVETGLPDALGVAERVRRSIEGFDFGDLAPGLGLTASLGVTAYLPGEEVQHTLDRADRALYQAKLAGRNRVEIA